LPDGSPDIVVLIPVPLVKTPPGERVNIHVPDEGKLPNNTLPVGTTHVGLVIVPMEGAAGSAFTLTVQVANASHANGSELFAITVIVTILPSSAEEGV